MTHLCSCVSPTTRAWLLVHPRTPLFCLFSAHFLTTSHIFISIYHILQFCIFHNAKCGHTIDDLGIHLLHCLCENEHIATHDTLQDTIAAITSKNEVHVQNRFFTFSLTTHEDEWILSSPKIVFEPWWMLSLPIQLV